MGVRTGTSDHHLSGSAPESIDRAAIALRQIGDRGATQRSTAQRSARRTDKRPTKQVNWRRAKKWHAGPTERKNNALLIDCHWPQRAVF